MSELNGRKVLKVQCHDVAHVTGLGNTKNTVDANIGGFQGKAELTYLDGGVFVKGVSSTREKFEFLIPQSMCKLIQFVNE